MSNSAALNRRGPHSGTPRASGLTRPFRVAGGAGLRLGVSGWAPGYRCYRRKWAPTSPVATSPYVDGQIAAIARVNDLILVTGNVKDFTRFKDLAVEDWTRARA